MNRTKIALKGTYISIFFTVIQGLLTFWRTRIIITTYGTDVNSISAAATQVFSYLVLFESGLGAAYLFKMYRPYANKDFQRVNALYIGLANSLKRISVKMLVGVIAAAILYPLILGENSVAYVRAVMIILLLGIRFVYPYYFTLAKKNMLIVQERQYMVTLIDGIINSCIILVEILLAQVFKLEVEFVLSVGILFSIISNEVYKIILNKWCSDFINQDVTPSYEGNSMTNDILVHQIASLANSHIDTLILSVFDVFMVTVYTSYNSLMNYPVTLVNKVINNLRASIGLKLSKNDTNIYSVFKEIMSINYFVAAIVTSTFIVMVNKFIFLWIGEQFLLDNFSVILFASILLHRLIINTIYAVRDGKGLYRESKHYTLATAIINFLLSLLLVKPFGIKGLLLSTVLSTYLIMDLGNFYLVYNNIFKKRLLSLYKDLFLLLVAVTCSVMSSNYIIVQIQNYAVINWGMFILESLITIFISAIFITLILFLFDGYFKKAIKRLLLNIKNW